MAGKDKKGKKLKKVRKDGEGLRAANKPEYVTDTGQKLWRVHPATACNGRICDIHNPPQGLPESGWPTHWRADRQLMERICPHGIGHPSKSHMAYLFEQDVHNGTDHANYEGIHGCDGCCVGENRRQPWNGQDEEEPFRLDEEFEPYFDDSPLLPYNGASDRERGVDWSRLFPPFQRIPHRADFFADFFAIRQEEVPEWVDQNAAPNGIGPVCVSCHLLIDSHPQDHAQDCPWWL